MNAADAQAVRSLLRSLASNFRRFFADGEPLAEPIDLYPAPAVANPDERRSVLEALLESAAETRDPRDLDDQGPTDVSSNASATVADLRRATHFPDARLRSALDVLGKQRLVRVEVHTLSRRFKLHPRHELRFHITAEGCDHLRYLTALDRLFLADDVAGRETKPS